MQLLGYQVLTATNGQEAQSLFQQHQHKIDLVLTDMSIPKINGVTLAKILHTKDKSIKIITLTGYPFNVNDEHIARAKFVEWLRKPLTREQVAQVVGQVLQRE